MKKLKAIGGSVIALLLVAVIVGTSVASAMFYDFANDYWSSLKGASNSALPADYTLEDAFVTSREVNVRGMEEGAILLRNENKLLPLGESAKVNLFGYASVDVTEAVGSATATGSTLEKYNFKRGFEEAGLAVNGDLYDWYKANTDKSNTSNFFDFSVEYNVPEIKLSDIPANVLSAAKDYSPVAVYVIGRVGSEESDPPSNMDGEGKYQDTTYDGRMRKYLQLTDTERENLQALKAQGFQVVVLVNSTSIIELGEMEDYKIDACVFMGTPGAVGTIGIGNLLQGKVNFSGRATDTFAYDMSDAPAYNTYSTFQPINGVSTRVRNYYANASAWADSFQKEVDSYYHYYEGIYVGYKFYETRWIEDDNTYTPAGEAEYQKHVQYPFGYGLSYTSFEWSNPVWTIGEKGGKITVSVDVQNTGSVAGKDVVELYYSLPFYNKGADTLEKAAVNLGGYVKTALLEPGQKETYTIEMDFDELASYDYKINKAYVLEHGDYTFSLRTDAHTPVFTQDWTLGADIIYDDAHDGKRATDLVAATNQFDYANDDGNIIYVSRSDWEGTMPQGFDSEKEGVMLSQANIDRYLDPETLGANVDPISKDAEHQKGSSKPLTEQENGLTVRDMVGVAWDDPKWDTLLDQMTVNEMKTINAKAAYRINGAESIGMETVLDVDGPSGVNAPTVGKYGTAFINGTIMASTWNDELIEELGVALGDEFILVGAAGCYGPAFNIHRSPLNGRNSEYYSEDSFLTGKVAAANTRGLQAHGLYVYAKHYAAYAVSSEASFCSVWLNEQALREIYVKAFEMAVKEGQAEGIMCSYTGLGTSRNVMDYGLLTQLPRNEWGFRGVIISDAITSGYDYDLAIRAGLNLCLNPSASNGSLSGKTVTKATTSSVYGMECLRESTKEIVYRYVNSVAMGIEHDTNPGWLYIIIGMNVLFALIAAGVVTLVVVPSLKRRKTA